MDLAELYRVFHPMTADYTFPSAAQNFFQNRPYSRSQSKPQQMQKTGNNPL
jgi:hypothetical protein